MYREKIRKLIKSWQSSQVEIFELEFLCSMRQIINASKLNSDFEQMSEKVTFRRPNIGVLFQMIILSNDNFVK